LLAATKPIPLPAVMEGDRKDVRYMRQRDVTAIAFCTVTILGLFAAIVALSRSYLAAFCIAAAYALWLLTRPRMIRVSRRLRGRKISEWRGYFDD
jgi:hypothetical protein